MESKMAADVKDTEESCKEPELEEDKFLSFVEGYPTPRFQCNYPGCGKIIKRKKQYRDHYRTHTGEKPYCCTECGKAFGRPYHLKRHQAVHLKDVGFKCSYEDCSYHCKFHSNLKRHIKRIHEATKPFKCSVGDCPLSFKKHKEKTAHESSHTGDKPFKCEEKECEKSYSSHKSLKNHLKIHKKEKGYSCTNEACDAIFYTWTDLQKHLFVCKVHKCASCGKIFRANWQLKKHETIHDSNRCFFKCPVENCDREYTTESNVVAHIRSCHQDERTFVCPEESCGQSFAHKCSLKRHLSNHERILKMYKRMAKNKKKKEKKRRKQTRVHLSSRSKVTGIITELESFISDSDAKGTSDHEGHSEAGEEDNPTKEAGKGEKVSPTGQIPYLDGNDSPDKNSGIPARCDLKPK